MEGQVVSYSGGVLTIYPDTTGTGGSGPFTGWSVYVAGFGPIGPQGNQGNQGNQGSQGPYPSGQTISLNLARSDGAGYYILNFINGALVSSQYYRNEL
jgi:hypothetical protein